MQTAGRNHLREEIMHLCRLITFGILAACGAGSMTSQQSVTLPPAPPPSSAAGQSFAFASDGPIGPGWTRPDNIARVYVDENLPSLFTRTIQLSEDLPARTKLTWIFTGPHAGVSVELTSSKVVLLQRAYDSTGLASSGSFPEKVLRTDERTYTGHLRTITLVVDSHLSVSLLINGAAMLTQPFVYDLTRQQLMFSGPRNEHLTASGVLLKEKSHDATIQVNPDKIHQTMIGFGGSPSIPAYAHLSDRGKELYWDILRRYNLLIDREYPMGSELKPDLSNATDLNDATPHYYGDNFPNGEVSNFEYMRKTREVGGQVLYEMWALPHWATQAYTPQGKSIIDAWGKSVKTAAKPEVYAKIVADFCARARERSGAAPEIIGIQNEVEQAPEIYAAMTTAVRKALDAAGFAGTKIQMADAPYVWMAVNRIRDEKQYQQAWSATDFVASHQYDVQEFLADPDLYDERLQALHQDSDGKPFLATEICLNDGKYQEPSYRLALQVAQLYEKDLVEADAEMLLYCWLLLDVEQPTFGSSRSLLVPDRTNGQIPIASSFQLRVLGAYSRHILKGMRRVDTSSADTDLLSTAFTDGKHHSLIVLNRSTSPQKLRINWVGTKWTSLERTSFYSQNDETVFPDEVTIAPGELVTLSDFKAM